MRKDVPLTEIVDNPFQPRQEFDQASIESLAAEIKAEGFWNGALQGRRTKNGKIELVFGHRRLRALRLLKLPSVAVEVVDLTDTEMARRSLEENLQRQGLTELEKADGVRQLVELERATLTAAGRSTHGATELVAKRLGLTHQWVSELVNASAVLVADERKLVEKTSLSATAAARAKEWGGSEYVKTLAEQAAQHEKEPSIAKPSRQTVVNMRAEVNAAPKAVQERLKKAIVTGKVRTRAEAQTHARRLAADHVRREKEPPPDLKDVLVGWTHRAKDWEQQMRDVVPYMAYAEEVPAVTERFRAALKQLIETAKQLL